jgi:hypothetical protein
MLTGFWGAAANGGFQEASSPARKAPESKMSRGGTGK